MKKTSHPTTSWAASESIAATIGMAVAATLFVSNSPTQISTLGIVPGILLMLATGFAATRVAHALGFSSWVAAPPALLLVATLP